MLEFVVPEARSRFAGHGSTEIRLDTTSTAIPRKRMKFSGRNPCVRKGMGIRNSYRVSAGSIDDASHAPRFVGTVGLCSAASDIPAGVGGRPKRGFAQSRTLERCRTHAGKRKLPSLRWFATTSPVSPQCPFYTSRTKVCAASFVKFF